jgi:hypothetical protein
MKKYSRLLLSTFLLYSKLHAQNTNYDVQLIAPELLTHANAITRTQQTKLVIKNIGSATVYYTSAITILNEAGANYARFEEFYDKFQTISDIEGELYDAQGKKIRSMKKNELFDGAATDGFSLVDDARVKTHDFSASVYPYTVEYTYTVEMNGLMFLPLWEPVQGYNFAVENSELTVECPSTYQLRYKSFDYTTSPTILSANNNITYYWAVKGFAAITKEKYSPLLKQITPSILLAPTDFKWGDYTGNMNSWKNLSNFFYLLNQGRDVLPDNIKLTVHQLTDKVTDTVSKIKLLYEYLQKNTRYVSVQLGIGGWQTFDAGYVAKNDYGDCKALSNYMHSLLKEAGIKSNCILINAGRFNTYLDNDFPSAHFNHVIVCVPMAKDSIWLECTSRTLPMGYLSGFTADREALLIDETGGKLVHTPVYKMSDNLQQRNIQATVDENGNLSATVNTRVKGMEEDHLHGLIHELSNEKIGEYLKNNIDLPSYDVTTFKYTEDSLLVPSIYEKLELTVNNYAQVTGKRLFIMPNLLSKADTKLNVGDEHKTIIKLPYQYADVDTVEIQMPAGYTPESIPADIVIDTKFGKYSASVKVIGNKLLYYRKYQQANGDFPATDYADLVAYFDKIYRSDHAKAVLIKSDLQNN